MTQPADIRPDAPEPKQYLKRVHDGGGRAAVVFIHGFSGDARKTWENFPDFLSKKSELKGWDVYTMGYETALYPDILRGIWSANAGLETLAGLLRTTLTLGRLSTYEAVAIIAHSMGGLVAQRALLDTDVRKRVSHLFLFGTPSGGLIKAGLVRRFKTQFRDMAPNSDFLKNLRKRWAAEFAGGTPFQLFVMAGESDQFVPEDRAFVDDFPESVRNRVPRNHVQMVKPKRADDLSVEVVTKGLVGGAGANEVWNAASVAAQDRQSRALVDRFWLTRAGLDQPALVDLALALERIGRQQDAFEVLEKYGKSESTDRMGTLAGRFKRKWLSRRQQADAERALELYRRGLTLSESAGDWPQAFYHAINVAFMEFAFTGDRKATQVAAEKALEYCRRSKPDLWAQATCAEARLYLGESDAAIEAYRQALFPENEAWAASPWQVTSMYDQAIEVAERLGDKTLGKRLTTLFRGGTPASRLAASGSSPA